MAIVKRLDKGSALTYAELDGNFDHLTAADAVIQADVNAHEARTDNPHSVTKTQVGLGSVDNTADADKPVSTATQTAIDNHINDTAGAHADSAITFTPAGTGAVATTVQAKLREMPTRADYSSEANYIAAAEALQTGGFWTDETTVGRIYRLSDRLFIDDAVQFNGEWAGTDNDYSPIPRWPSREASFLAWSSIGRNAIVGLSKTSLGITDPGGTPTSADSAIGVIGIAINDYVGSDNRNAFGGYFESWKGSGSIKAAFGIEVDVGNDSSTDQTNNPFSPFGAGTFGLNISAGGSKGSAYANPSSCAIVIASNPSTFNKGIVFGADAITGTDGVTGTAIAIEFAKGHVISWRETDGTTTDIYSSVADTANKVKQEFTDNIIRFLGAGNNVLGQFEHVASSVNYLRILPGTTGNPAELRSGGGDTDIDVKLVPKGAGLVRFGTHAAVTTETLSGFITIKDANGTSRKVAVVA